MNKELLGRLESLYEEMSPTEKKIADYLKEADANTCYLSIQELAAQIDVSPSAISRFTKRTGFNNYQEMRLMLAESQAESEEEVFFPEIDEHDTIMNIAKATFHNGISSLSSTLAMLNEDSLTKALRILTNAKRCGVFGLGASKVMGEAACQRFLRTSLDTRFFSDYHMQLMLAGTLTEKDCALIISHTGRNKDILRVADILQHNHVPTIVITSSASAPLTRKCDVFLFCVSEESKYRPEAISSSISHLMLIDTLFTLYAIKSDSDPDYFTRIRRIVNSTRQ